MRVERQSVESAFAFECEGEQLAAVLHASATHSEVGVVIVVGGPQYRVGSHRQFVLLARALSASGIPTLRFDYRGMGDSGGEVRGFERVANDIRASIDALIARAPGVKKVVLWGLCDGATASSFYAPGDARVAGVVLLNPWVRSAETLAKSMLRNYYVERLLDGAAWKQLLLDPRRIARAVSSVFGMAAKVVGLGRAPGKSGTDSVEQPNSPTQKSAAAPTSTGALVERMATALDKFNGPILVVLSSADITANEFSEGVRGNSRLRRRLERKDVAHETLVDADHTFSKREWRDRVASWTTNWVSANHSNKG